ncbi:T6SS effector phospholipase Tle3 domain-containing protein [Enterobacter asburiae]|uniref:T6SS effector phospholipase Tle3 domain-containing protein n=1 Tax=Enterobacter asburiae TaxID=61645 RepID=UPI0034CEBE05
MTGVRKSPYCPRVISENDIPVHKSLGLVAQTRKVGVPRPMPCIVILVHGVNDVGEAYQNQEKGIIAGLSKRLNRSDLYAHEWKDFIMSHNEEAQQKICEPGRSPVIPFYWGYKPVTHEEWRADQKRYRDEVGKLGNEAHIPYDAYQEDNETKRAALGNDSQGAYVFQNDCFKNALDINFAKGGGTFANATTSIPDMLGPGAGGVVVAATGFMTLHANGGDFTHPIFPNPHRIYQFFAAQRLADLIIQIRKEPVTENDVINIVAHSQGTIITMLANMLVKQAGYDPVNCTILTHSPYSLEERLLENAQSGHHQTSAARQQTFSNFCALMATQYKGGEVTEADMLAMEAACTLRKPSDNLLRQDARFRRDNNGKVYNYFCPNDGTVSLKNIQGIGWRGIPQNIACHIPNLYQRVFYQHGHVGLPPDKTCFELPAIHKGDAKYSSVTNAIYSARDVVINGEELPEPFVFELQGEKNRKDNDPKTCYIPYEAYIDPESPDAYISYSAKAHALSRTASGMFPMDKYYYPTMKPGHSLTPDELQEMTVERKHKVIQGVVSGVDTFRNLTLVWLKNRDELEDEWKKADPVGYSQHSSIVMSECAPSQAMAFDLAIGQCKSFDFKAGRFWEDLLHRADWRDPLNKNSYATDYYKTGRLNKENTKDFMNKPQDVLPKGCFGVVNDYVRTRPNQRNKLEIDTGIVKSASFEEKNILQWDMPRALSLSQINEK